MKYISQYELLTRYSTYRMARFYCNSCGFAVIPLRPRSKKRVFRDNHFQTWFPREDHLRKWFCNALQYGIAIVPGLVSGNLVILDFDAPGSFEIWHQATGIETPRVLSARGVHVYVRLQKVVTNGKGVFQGQVFGDVIAGGNITAPPSLHPSGKIYQWVGDPRGVPLFPCLASLDVSRIPPNEKHTRDRRPMPKKRYQDRDAAPRIINPYAYVHAAIIGEKQHLLQSATGSRNYQLYQSALKLAKYLEIVSQPELEMELKRVALQAGLDEEEIGPTIQSGLRTGIEHGLIRG